MNQVVYEIGPITIHAFTAWIMIGAAIGAAILIAQAALRHDRLNPWLDVIVAAVVGGVIGARAGHVLLNWAYFSANTDQITSLTNGGLDWHGAAALGLLAAVVVAFIRRVPLTPLLDGLALALPIGAIAGWQACGVATCGYGLEVRTLADFPSWLVVESQDIYGTVAPRLNLLPVGVALAVIVLILIIDWTVFGWLRGLRIWLALSFFSLGMGVLDFFRAEYVPIWFDHRADQILDFAVALAAILIFGIAGFAALARHEPIIPPNRRNVIVTKA